MGMQSHMYNGHWIEENYYGKGEYTVFVDGEDVWFDTLEEAKAFIDRLEEEENGDEDY